MPSAIRQLKSRQERTKNPLNASNTADLVASKPRPHSELTSLSDDSRSKSRMASTFSPLAPFSLFPPPILAVQGVPDVPLAWNQR